MTGLLRFKSRYQSSREIMSDSQAELHEYLKANNLNAIFVSIVEAILVEKPSNPIGFMTKYLLVSSSAYSILPSLFKYVPLTSCHC